VVHGDYSPEELRCEAYAQMRSLGNIKQYISTLDKILLERRQKIIELLSDLSRSVALARTPRASRVDSTQFATSIPIPEPPSLESQKHQSILNFDVAQSFDIDSFTFGNIPEHPPS